MVDGHPSVDLADDTYLACHPALVATAVSDPVRWAAWWPDLTLRTSRDRGLKGRQWSVQGALVGTAEIWLEPWWDGVVLHFYLRADRSGRGGAATVPPDDEEQRRRTARWKGQVHRLKDELEGNRRPGEPAAGAFASVGGSHDG